MNLFKKLLLVSILGLISNVTFSKDYYITPVGFKTEYNRLFEFGGNILNTGILFQAGDKIHFITSFGIGYRNRPLRSEDGIECRSFVNFNLSPIITPIKTKWLELKFSVGPTLSEYTSNIAIAWGSSPNRPDVILQHIKSDYKWRVGIDTGVDLIFPISKEISLGVKMGYLSYLDKVDRYNINEFFTYGMNLNYYFNKPSK